MCSLLFHTHSICLPLLLPVNASLYNVENKFLGWKYILIVFVLLSMINGRDGKNKQNLNYRMPLRNARAKTMKNLKETRYKLISISWKWNFIFALRHIACDKSVIDLFAFEEEYSTFGWISRYMVRLSSLAQTSISSLYNFEIQYIILYSYHLYVFIFLVCYLPGCFKFQSKIRACEMYNFVSIVSISSMWPMCYFVGVCQPFPHFGMDLEIVIFESCFWVNTIKRNLVVDQLLV